MVNQEYDVIRKIILKNIRIQHEIGQVIVMPAVIKQLEQYFLNKFESEVLRDDYDEKVWEPFKDDY